VKTLAPGQAAVVSGGTASFDITIFNQGDFDAFNVIVSDYLPAGFTLDDDNWNLNTSNPNIAETVIPGPITAGSDILISITLAVPETTVGGFTNVAEISEARGSTGDLQTDVDSTANNDPSDDPPVIDDAVDGEAGDEDDHDIAVFDVKVFDLALTKQLADGQPSIIAPGDTVTFDITIFNQGDLPAYDTEVIDFIPTGTFLSDSDWSQSAGNALRMVDGPIPAGSSQTIQISIVVSDASGDVVNVAEIARSAAAPGGVSVEDIDSEPDTIGGNDLEIDGETNNPDDEDDSDPAGFRVQAAGLGNFVWVDLNADGIQDLGEPGLAGVNVTLFDSAGASVAFATTDSSGAYSFSSQPLGTYTVGFSLAGLSGYTNTLQDVGSDLLDSDAGASGLTGTVSLNSDGEFNDTVDFGVYQLGEIMGLLWHDLNNNGLEDEGAEYMGIPGVVISLFIVDDSGSETFYLETVTDASGAYGFFDLPLGNYRVTYDPADVPLNDPPYEPGLGGLMSYNVNVSSGTQSLNLFPLITNPTAIDLLAFFGEDLGNRVELTWTTASETDNLGFNLYRSDSPDGVRVRINESLILAANELHGATYTFIDEEVEDGTWFYWLEDIELNLKSTLNGPTMVFVGPKTDNPFFAVESEGIYLVMVPNPGGTDVVANQKVIPSTIAGGGLVFYLAGPSFVELRPSISPSRMDVVDATPVDGAEVAIIVSEQREASITLAVDSNILVHDVGDKAIALDLEDFEQPVVLQGRMVKTDTHGAYYFFSQAGITVKVSGL